LRIDDDQIGSPALEQSIRNADELAVTLGCIFAAGYETALLQA
jgi:hypothetical protein